MKKLILIIAFAFIFAMPSYAAEYNDVMNEIGASELVDSLDSETRQLLDEVYGGFEFEKMEEPEALFSTLADIASEKAFKPLGALTMLIGIIVASAVAGNLNLKNEMTSTINFMISLMTAAVLMMPIASFIEKVSDVIQNSQVFISAYVPVYAAIVVSSGSPATAASYCTLTVAASEISAFVITEFLLPMTGIFSGISLVAGMTDIFKLDRLAFGAEKLIKSAIGIISTVFIGILSVKTIISSCGDSVAYRSAKYVVSGFVPVAGGILGESLATVFSFMKYIKGTVGAFGIIAGGFIFLPVIAECVIWQLCVGAAGYMADVFDVKSASSILKSAGSILGIVMYLILFMILLLIVTTAAVLIGGGA